MSSEANRVVVWFSAGATSAVAAKLVREEMRASGDRRELVVAYCDTRSEHEDNYRFLCDVSEWIDWPILMLHNDDYKDIWDVFKKTRWLVGPEGARCTAELKKVVRNRFQRVSDVQVFGFDLDEKKRIEKFEGNNPEVNLWTPLIDRQLSKGDCLAMLEKAGIEIPVMYRLGYDHNNCVGCVKGGMGYWNKIRVDFPDVFDRMARTEREIGAAICKTEPVDKATGKRTRLPVYLDELHPEAGRGVKEPNIECSVFCAAAWGDIG